MPIITTDEVKELSQMDLRDSSKDLLIDTLIPIAQGEIVRYCRNSFLNYEVQAVSDLISFDANTISGDFTGFTAGEYKISGSKLNNGIVTVASATDSALTVSETLKNEEAGNEITITKVEYPEDIKYSVAMLIKYMMAKEGKLVNSESVSGYSAQFKSKKDLMFELFADWRK